MQNTPHSGESHAPESSMGTRFNPMARRTSLEELRSNNASPLLSLRGLYVRSRSPSPNFANWPHRPLPELPDYGGYQDTRTAFHGAHLATSFAAFDTREKERIPGTPHPRGRARVLSSASVDDAYVAASRVSGALPAHAHGARGIATGEAVEDDDDVIVYMLEKRTSVAQSMEVQRRAAAASARHNIAAHAGASVAAEPRACYAPQRQASKPHSVKFSTKDTIATFPRLSQEVQSLRGDVWPAGRSFQQHSYDGSFFEHLDDDEEEDGKKRKSAESWTKAVKEVFKRFSGPRKAAAPTDDRSSTRSSMDNMPPTPEQMKASSASLINMRLGAARPPTPGAKSMRAPSILSTRSRNVLLKRRKSNKGNR